MVSQDVTPVVREGALANAKTPEPPKRFLRFGDLKTAGVPFSRMHIHRLERAGQFPRRVLLGAKTVAWVGTEVEAWLKARCEARVVA
jgi:prophage regulatory protein